MEVMSVKPYFKGAMRAFVDLYVPKWGVELYGCGLFQKDARWWISMPSREYTDDAGERKFMQIARFKEKDHAFAWSDSVVPLVHAYCEKNNINIAGDDGVVVRKTEETGELPF